MQTGQGEGRSWEPQLVGKGEEEGLKPWNWAEGEERGRGSASEVSSLRKSEVE